MNTKTILFLFLALVLCHACSKEEDKEEQPTGIQPEGIFEEGQVLEVFDDCRDIIYDSRIGYDFDSAVDSFVVLSIFSRDELRELDTMSVDFDYDDRFFINAYFINGDFTHSESCVFDTKGNYFRILYCPD